MGFVRFIQDAVRAPCAFSLPPNTFESTALTCFVVRTIQNTHGKKKKKNKKQTNTCCSEQTFLVADDPTLGSVFLHVRDDVLGSVVSSDPDVRPEEMVASDPPVGYSARNDAWMQRWMGGPGRKTPRQRSRSSHKVLVLSPDLNTQVLVFERFCRVQSSEEVRSN